MDRCLGKLTAAWLQGIWGVGSLKDQLHAAFVDFATFCRERGIVYVCLNIMLGISPVCPCLVDHCKVLVIISSKTAYTLAPVGIMLRFYILLIINNNIINPKVPTYRY